MKFNKLFLFLFLGIFLFGVLPSVSAFDWSEGLPAYYKLDETSGDVVDATGNGNNGTNYGATRGVTGKINNAFDFNGTDYVDFGDISWIDSTKDLTISIWINLSEIKTSSEYILGKTGGSGADDLVFYLKLISGNKLDFSIRSVNDVNSQIITDDAIPTDGFHLINLVADNTNLSIYIDGEISKSGARSDYDYFNPSSTILALGRWGSYDGGYFNGTIDEFGIWNRSLSSAEISELYNSSYGLPYEITFIAQQVTLISPINGTTISDVGANFTAQFNITGTNEYNYTWKNATYYVWKNESEFNTTTVTLSGNNTEYEQFIDDFTLGDYIWNVKAYYGNDTFANYTWASSNYSLEVNLYSLVDENYVNDTISGTLENFSISIDLLPDIELTDAKFYYEGEYRTPSINALDGNRFILISDYQIPLITEDVNNSFYWEFEFNNDETVETDNRTQLVRAVFLDNCGTYTNRLFNISLYDEITTSSLSGNIELIYTLLNKNYQTIKTYNFSAEGVSNTYVCSALNLSDEDLYYSAEIRYESENYSSELYNIQKSQVSEDTQQINLYDLNSSSSTEFKITYQDSTFNFVENAIIQLQRKYIGENQYRVVEAPLTSSEGISILHIDLDSVKYRATVVKDGVVLDEFDNLVFKCDSELTGECEYKLLGKIDPQNDIDLSDTLDFYYSDPVLSNGTIITSFNIPSNTPSVINVVLEQKDMYGNVTLYNKTITSSAGLISAEYSDSLGESYIDLKIYKDGVPMVTKTYVLHPSEGLDWLGNNYIFIVVILLSLVGMALSSPEWIILNGIITMVISGGLWLASGLDFVMGLGSIMWLIISAIILISKMSKQEDR